MTYPRYLYIFISILFGLCSCNDLEVLEDTQPLNFEVNNSRPEHPESFKILAIGNSFTIDGTRFLPFLLNEAGIENVTIATLTDNGCTLQQHYTYLKRNESAYQFCINDASGWTTIGNNYKMKKALEYTDWDMVILQQASSNSGQYKTYQPYLNALMNQIHACIGNPDLIFGWQMTWAYASNCKNDAFKNYKKKQATMYDKIVDAVRKMQAETGIGIIIPSGAAIQNLRATEVNNYPQDLTDDGTHIDPGVGRYTLACTWFLSLVSPVTGQTPLPDVWFGEPSRVVVTDNNYKICQQAAIDACREWEYGK